MLAPWKKSYDQPRQHIKKQRHYFASKGSSSQSYGFSSNHVWMWELDYKKLSTKELMLLNCGVGEDSWESLELQDPTSPSCRKSVLNIHWKDWCWSWSSSTLATWCKELTHWKRPWCWERLKAGGQGDNIGWKGWMASLIQLTWVWASCRSWWGTGKPSMLQSMGLQRVGQNWVTELNWFCLAQHPPDSSTLWHVSEFLFFLRMNNVLFHVYTTFFWSIHLITDTWVVSTFWLLWIMLLRTWVHKYLFEFLFSILWGHAPGSRMARSYDNSIFNFLRIHYTSGCTI